MGKNVEDMKIASSPIHSLHPQSASLNTHNEFTIRTAFKRYSAQKLNEVARLLPKCTNLPSALVQMRLGQTRKGAYMFCVPLLHAAINAVRMRPPPHNCPEDYSVLQALVGRGRYRKRLDIKGRGRFGIIRRPSCFLRIVVGVRDREGKMKRELARWLRRTMRKEVREDRPIYKRMLY